MVDNTELNLGDGGNLARSLEDGSGRHWYPSVVSYATTLSPGANALQPVTSAFPLPVGLVAALPAGTNLLGAAAASPDTSTIYAGTTALTPKFAAISASSSGDNTVVAAVTGKKIRVLGWSLTSNGTVNVRWKSGAATNLTGLRYLIQYASAGGSPTPFGRFETASGEALVLNLSAAVAVGGELQYIEV